METSTWYFKHNKKNWIMNIYKTGNYWIFFIMITDPFSKSIVLTSIPIEDLKFVYSVPQIVDPDPITCIIEPSRFYNDFESTWRRWHLCWGLWGCQGSRDIKEIENKSSINSKLGDSCPIFRIGCLIPSCFISTW